MVGRENRNIKLGLIGVGKWGINYVNTIEEFENISLTSVCTKNEKVKDLIPKDCKIFNDWEDMIQSNDFDGLILSTPTNTHYSISKRILEMGIPLLSEKPLATNISEINNLLKICISKKNILMVNYIHLYHYGFEKLLSLISARTKESLKNIYSESGNDGPFRKDTRALWDWGVHDIAICLKLTKEYPYKIKSNFIKLSERGPSEGEIIKTILYFPSGISAILIFGNLFDKKVKKFVANFDDFKLIYNPLAKTSLLKVPNNNSSKFINQFQKVSEYSLEKPLKKCIRLFSEKIINKDYSMDDMELTLKITKIIDIIEHQLSF